MPQDNNQYNGTFGIYYDAVLGLERYVQSDNPYLQGDEHANINQDSRKWTQTDLYNMATNKVGYGYFNILVEIARSAKKQNPDGTYDRQAEQAQAALYAFSPEPDGKKMQWQEFYNMISNVHAATKEKRAEFAVQDAKRKAQAKPEGEPQSSLRSDISILDQQAALALLDAHGVKLDATHELKSPDPKAMALNVVQNMKDSVRAA